MNIAEILEEDHHHIDGRLATFVAGLDEGEVRPADFRASATALRRHIHAEEVHLFPPLRAAGMIPPVLVMLREHGIIWGLLERIDALLAVEPPEATALRQECDGLTERLEAHNMKEERIIYPAAEQTLDADTMASVRDALDEETPPGWRCEMAP